MAKFKGQVVVLEETNLPALFYYRHLLEKRVGNPVYYFDEIDKKGIDNIFLSSFPDGTNGHKLGWNVSEESKMINDIINSVTKTVYHGFKYTVVHEEVKDEGLANKLQKEIQKKIKNHEEPYNDIFKKYSCHVYNG